MLKIFRYLKESKWSVLAIIVLLVVQAYCDLALPQYTADIVDIGIGQKGIRDGVPEKMGESVYEGLAVFMTDEERALLNSAYERDEEGNYVFCGSGEDREALNKCLGIPMLIYSALNSENNPAKDLSIGSALPEEGSGEEAAYILEGADTAGAGGVWGYPHRPEGGAVRLAGIRKAGHGPRQAPEGLSAGDRRQDACLFGGDDGRSHFGGAAGV